LVDWCDKHMNAHQFPSIFSKILHYLSPLPPPKYWVACNQCLAKGFRPWNGTSSYLNGI
jgi:hypothetical protein